jgi:hypothetical protein
VAIHWWRPAEHYEVCDFIVDQFEYDRKPGGGAGTDTPSSFRDAGLAVAADDGIQIIFSMNVLDGGKRGVDCYAPGTLEGNCWMSPTDLRDAGLVLGLAGSGLLMWEYRSNMWGQVPYQDAAEAIASNLATQPRKSWLRP